MQTIKLIDENNKITPKFSEDQKILDVIFKKHEFCSSEIYDIIKTMEKEQYFVMVNEIGSALYLRKKILGKYNLI